MIKTIEIVSLSRGILGEAFIKHELDLGIERLKQLGITVTFSKHALKGIDFLDKHPEKRAEDLLAAFKNETIDMILCAIGGDDTYRLLPYLFDKDELKQVVNQKPFLGFSDTTINHLMLHQLGIKTFYGQAFLPDIAELDKKMLPYSQKYLKELLATKTISEIRPSDVWYEERTDFSAKALGTKRQSHPNQGWELLQGESVFSGKILGGCLESLYGLFDGTRHNDSPILAKKYQLFPDLADWQGRLLLLETSEEKPSPKLYQKMLETLKETGVFSVINGLLVGKPMDETYYEAYKKILVDVVDNPSLPILYNLNVGHATPRAIVPFGVVANIDAKKQVIQFENEH
ncbi:S66 family peptidase [Streptococcus pacificus]|uniref:LD-carboxypeptidase n=1 Tax=Streptococcus pacificus TaxID=2740577 RepID=A0ABS0ZKE8_9STRE|nr:S66 peptidase family protein [Streptococcus pacificus]MBJ8326468.1 LD-carboxypeptidase [Streptococcus pacificus]